MGKPKLTGKQARFIAEYLIDGNGTQAAIRAGYSVKTAQQIATENLCKPLIKTAIANEQAKIAGKMEITAARVLDEMAKIAFSDLRGLMDEDGRLLPVKDWPDGAAGAISSMEILSGSDGSAPVIKLKTWDKNSGLEKLAKHLGLFEKDNSQGAGVNITIGAKDAAGF